MNQVTFPTTSDIEILRRVKISQLSIYKERGYTLHEKEDKFLIIAEIIERRDESPYVYFTDEERDIITLYDIEPKIWNETATKGELRFFKETEPMLEEVNLKGCFFTNLYIHDIEEVSKKNKGSILDRIDYDSLNGIFKKREIKAYIHKEYNFKQTIVTNFIPINPNGKNRGTDLQAINERRFSFKDLDLNDKYQIILVVITPYKFSASELSAIKDLIPTNSKNVLQIFEWAQILATPLNHTLAPRYYPLSIDKTKDKLEEMRATPFQFPSIKNEDQAVKTGSWRKKTIVKIIRPNLINSESMETERVYYRVIV